VIDSWLLFGHVVGVIVLVVGIGLEGYSVAASVRATTIAELRLAVRPARVLPAVMPLATLLMTGCGLALVAHDSTDFHFGDAWVVAAIGIVVAISVVGGGFSGRPATRLVDAADAAPEGPLPAHLTTLIHDPVLHASARSSAGTALWALWLMSVKPHAAGTLASLAVAVVLISVSSLMSARRRDAVRSAAERSESSAPK
jgi:uncharacterized membrane protein